MQFTITEPLDDESSLRDTQDHVPESFFYSGVDSEARTASQNLRGSSRALVASYYDMDLPPTGSQNDIEDGIGEAFYLRNADAAMLVGSQNLSGRRGVGSGANARNASEGAVIQSQLYRDFVRNASYGGPVGIAGYARRGMGAIRGVGMGVRGVGAGWFTDADGNTYSQDDVTDMIVSGQATQNDFSWNDGSDKITSDSRGNDLTSYFPDGRVVDETGIISGSINPGNIRTVADVSVLQQVLDKAPDLLKFMTDYQLAQVNLDRANKGLTPLNKGQVYGVAGAPPVISSTMIYATLGVVAAFALSGRKKR